MKLVILFLCLFPVFVLAQSPGGVRPNIQLWLKANKGVTNSSSQATNGHRVNTWRDMSGVRIRNANSETFNWFSAKMSTVNNPPVYRSSTLDNINYNPVVDFDGANDGLDLRDDFIFSSGAGNQNGMTWFAVVEPDAVKRQPQQFIFDFGGFENKGYGLMYGSSHFGMYTPREHSGAVVKNKAHNFSTQPVLINLTIRFRQTQTFSVNGGKPLASSSIRNLTKLTNNEINASHTHGIRNDNLHGPFSIGRQSQYYSPRVGNDREFNGSIAELIGFNRVLSARELKRVESYIALKYAITLNNAGGGAKGNYLSSDNVVIWDADNDPGYHKNIIAIGRDDGSELMQKQSHTAKDSMRIYLSVLAATNAINRGSFGSDGAFIVAGNNGDKMLFDKSNTEFPKNQRIYNRMGREWKITNTNFTGSFSMDIKLSNASVTAADVKLLIDDNGDFSNATVNSNDEVSITYQNGIVTVSGLNESLFPAGSTRYFTLASVKKREITIAKNPGSLALTDRPVLANNTALPLQLLSFGTKDISENSAVLHWKTSQEINNSHFEVERSGDGVNWIVVGHINGKNSHSINNYNFTDAQPLNGLNYYRLKQVDIDGVHTYSPVKVVRRTDSENAVKIYPNPFTRKITIAGRSIRRQDLRAYDFSGKNITGKLRFIGRGETKTVISLRNVPDGVYILKIKEEAFKVIKRGAKK